MNMSYEDFVGEVQHRAGMAARGDAVRAIHATMETLAEGLSTGEASSLAPRLPREIGFHFQRQPWRRIQRLSLHDFFQRVCIRERVDRTLAAEHAMAVVQVLRNAVTQDEMDEFRGRLPAEFSTLFEPAGREGGSACLV